MKFNAINKKKISEIAYICLLAISPLIIAEIYCACFGGSLTKLYLPANVWNDELYYYKIVAGMVKYGLPKGYFGYNEVPAVIGPFATWSPFIFFPYVIWGKIMGWNYHSMYCCNIFMMCIAYGIWGVSVSNSPRENFEKKVARCLSLVLMPLLIKYVLSGMAEALFLSLGMIWGVVFSDYGERKGAKVTTLIIAFYLTLCRPYYVLLFLGNIFQIVQQKKKRVFFMNTVLALVALLCSTVVRRFFCAPYFEETIRLEGILSSIIRFIKECKNIIIYIWQSLVGENQVGEIYLVYAVVSATLLVATIRAFNQEKKIGQYLYLIVSNIIMVFAITVLYDTQVGSRHLFTFILIEIVFVVDCVDVEARRSMCMVLLLIAFLIPKSSFYYKPYFLEDAGSLETKNRRQKVFENLMPLTDDTGWGNTVIEVLGCDYRVLYQVPDGMGINCCWQDYLNTSEIKSNYIICNPQVNIDNIVGFQKMYQDEKCILLIRQGESN